MYVKREMEPTVNTQKKTVNRTVENDSRTSGIYEGEKIEKNSFNKLVTTTS